MGPTPAPLSQASCPPVPAVRSPEGKIRLYCKGADTILLERLHPINQDLTSITTDHLNVRGTGSCRQGGEERMDAQEPELGFVPCPRNTTGDWGRHQGLPAHPALTTCRSTLARGCGRWCWPTETWRRATTGTGPSGCTELAVPLRPVRIIWLGSTMRWSMI